MNDLDDEAVYHNRYVLFDTNSETSAWWVDIYSKPKGVTVVMVNGVRQPKPPAEFERLIKADMEMQTAVSEFIVKVNEKE